MNMLILGGVLPGGAASSSAGPIAAILCPYGAILGLVVEGVEVAREDSARRVHPVPAVRRCLPLRRDPRADRAAAGSRAAARPAALGGACWCSVRC